MSSPKFRGRHGRRLAQLSLTCANCGQKLHVLEVHVCEACCSELMSDPNSSMYEEEDDG
ncbi:TPA_asm: protein ninF [Salmonella enterica subsp. salamae]|uniref:Protein ninF n=1 Tax=Salmonella enterica subsp. salamae TaxID=59202 RepID=A0A702PB52_SALER|nr:protein ninF [Salmonella enterica subsp. salamae serovar 9,46:l,w:e,n,x]HAC6954210.1 protein ninF [Salmonella enterica subsp. salamae]